jgi:hypothetical protein
MMGQPPSSLRRLRSDRLARPESVGVRGVQVPGGLLDWYFRPVLFTQDGEPQMVNSPTATTSDRTKHRSRDSRRRKPVQDLDAARECLMEWHTALASSVSRMIEVANAMEQEMRNNSNSPLHAFFEDYELGQLVERLGDLECSVLDCIPRPLAKDADLPNPLECASFRKATA